MSPNRWAREMIAVVTTEQARVKASHKALLMFEVSDEIAAEIAAFGREISHHEKR